MPLAVERVEWMAETRTVARGVITDLRSAGFVGGTVVLQWLPPDDVARIVARWIRRWGGGPARRPAITARGERALAGPRVLKTRTAASSTPAPLPDTPDA